MRVRHENFGSLQANTEELALAVGNDKELNNLLFCEAIARSGMLSNIH